MAEIADWFRSLPVFTRYWFGLSVVFPVLGRFRLVNPQHLVLSYDHFVRGFQVGEKKTVGAVVRLPFFARSLFLCA